MDDATKKAILDDILNRVGVDGIGNLVVEQNNTLNVMPQLPVQMPPHLTRERAMEIYTFLVDGNYIDKATSADDFLYLMGVTGTPPLKMKPINWINTVHQLREMLKLAFEKPLELGSLKFAEIERRAPYCFLNKGKKMSDLAKSGIEYSFEMSKLEEFFKPKNPLCN